MDLPKEDENAHLTQTLNKLDKEFSQIIRAQETTELLTQTLQFMETMKSLDD